MASILTDGPRFFINVLLDKGFRDTGMLYGVEAGGALGLHWVVLDPRKHVLHTWKKQTVNFVDAAAQLPATVVTNGPFFGYTGGNKWWATAKIGLRAIWEGFVINTTVSLGYLIPGLGLVGVYKAMKLGRNIQQSMVDNYSADHAVGHVHGRWGSETKMNAPNLHFFGRQGGRQFRHYTIQQGDPPKMEAVVGGLLPAVLNYQVATTASNTNQHGYWGLAPLDPTEQVWRDAQLDGALSEVLSDLHGMEDAEERELPKLTGLLITVFQSAPPANVAALMAGVLARDALQLDGADSVLLAVNQTVVVGAGMGVPKTLGNTWGYLMEAG